MARVGLARAGQKSADVARFLRIVDAYEKTFESQWHKRARRVIDRFADERRDADASRARFNVLWSNVETMKPFFYSATPKPVVSPRVDEDDEVAATAAEVLERALSFFIAEEGFGETLRYVRDDYLLAGRGTAWVRYVPHIEPLQVVDSIEAGGGTPDDEGDVGEPAPQPEQVAFEEVITDFVLWRDFGHTVARAWEEVDCVWRRVKMSRKALEARFGAEVGGKVPLDCSAHGEDRAREPDEDRDRAEVYELWCKSEKRAVWFTRSHADLLDDQQDPLGLPYFFPCPRPVYATLRTDSLVPIPDYVEYQDQAAELDDLTARIDALTDAIKCAGIYDKNFPALERLLQDGHDNELVPVESWAALVEKGGLNGSFDLLPMQEIAETLMLLYKARDAVKADLYEITGMSDIIRGNTAPEETATAQTIKSHFVTRRLAERQAQVERFARNLIDIMGHVIAGHFSPETLARITGMRLIPDVATKQALQGQAQAQPQGMVQPGMPAPLPPQVVEALGKPTWDEVMALLRDRPGRRFRIDIETDSMVAPDNAQEQAARTQFLETAGQFLAQAVQAGAQTPEMVPLLGRMLMFGVRGFRVGRELDDAFEQFVRVMDEKAKAAPPTGSQTPGPPPSPEMLRVQGELKLKEQAQAFDQQLRARQAEAEAARAAQDAQVEQVRLHMDAQVSLLVARINALAKIVAAGEAKGALPDLAEVAHQQQRGA